MSSCSSFQTPFRTPKRKHVSCDSTDSGDHEGAAARSASSPPPELRLLSQDDALFFSSPERLNFSAQALEAETQATRLVILTAQQEDKTTGAIYQRHVKRYAEWFEEDQARLAALDPRRLAALNPFPVTAAKVAAFLHHESTRPKVSQFLFFLR